MLVCCMIILYVTVPLYIYDQNWSEWLFILSSLPNVSDGDWHGLGKFPPQILLGLSIILPNPFYTFLFSYQYYIQIALLIYLPLKLVQIVFHLV